MSENFAGTVVVERVLSQLDAGCIFTCRREDGSVLRVKFAGRDTQPLPGDAFEVKGQLSSYRDRFGKSVAQVDSKRLRRTIRPGDLLRPWLERLPNIGAVRAHRLVDAFGHDLAAVLSDPTRMSEVAALIEPDKPALAAKIAAQVYAAVAALAGADKVKAATGRADMKKQYQAVTSANRIPLVQNGTVDIECGSTTNNAERRLKVAFTVPHYVTGARYLVRADSPIGELAGFTGKKLVSTAGTTPLKAITAANKERLLGITIVDAPDHARAVQMVEKGEADGFAMDDSLLFGLRSGSADPSKLKVVGKFLTIEPLAIMMSKDDPLLKQIVNDEMKRLIVSREIYVIYDRWFQAPIPPRNRALDLPMNYLLKDLWKYPTDWVPT